MEANTIGILNPKTKQSQPVPRHSEINEILAKSIIKTLTGDISK